MIIAGGFSGNNQLKTTEIVDLDAKIVYYGGKMQQARKAFHLATVNRGGYERLLALGGIGYTSGIGRVTLDTVEEWEPSGDTGNLWKKEKVTCEPGTWRTLKEKLDEPSESFGLVTVPEHSVCSTKS